jgi:Cd2+/Zn2+-exporting ATPase
MACCSAAGRRSRSWPTSTVVALDKTGTLTTGELAVVGYESFPPGRETEVMELAYALEAKSEHPLARAIVRDAKARGVRELPLADFQNIVGQGVRGSYSGGQALLGRRELLESGPLAAGPASCRRLRRNSPRCGSWVAT